MIRTRLEGPTFYTPSNYNIGDAIKLDFNALVSDEIYISESAVADDNSLDVEFLIKSEYYYDVVDALISERFPGETDMSISAKDHQKILEEVEETILQRAIAKLARHNVHNSAIMHTDIIDKADGFPDRDEATTYAIITVKFLLQPECLYSVDAWVSLSAEVDVDGMKISIPSNSIEGMLIHFGQQGNIMPIEEFAFEIAFMLPWHLHWRYSALRFDVEEEFGRTEFRYSFDEQISPESFDFYDIQKNPSTNPLIQSQLRPVLW